MTLDQDFVAELRRHFIGDIRLDVASRILYSTDASIYQVEPLGVVIPRTQEDLIAVVELAAKYKVPILPRGSGSSLAGQAIGKALILDCSRYLDHLPFGLNVESQTAVVEPGVILARLNKEAARFGLMFGPDPASAERATMGGVIGNNATGAHSILYGMTADHLVSADVILADGSLATWGNFNEALVGASSRQAEVVRTLTAIRESDAEVIKENWPRAWRNSAGYRLNYLLPWSATQPPQWKGAYPSEKASMAALLAGSEGTLAVMRQATVRLVPKPGYTILGVLNFDSLVDACDAVPDLLRKGPSAIELIPQLLIHLARNVPAYASQLGFAKNDPAALLVVEFSGDDMDVLRERARALRPDVLIAEAPADQARIWTVRKVGLGIFDSSAAEARPIAFIEDCAIPVDRLGEFVRGVEAILADHHTHAAFYAHASAGCLHIRPILNLKTLEGVRDLRSISQEVLLLTLRVGGSMSSEHGDGLARSEWLQQIYGGQVISAMKQLKQVADPDFILNPSNLFNAPQMDTNLRFGTDYRTKLWAPAMSYSRAGGLAGAIEQCNGQGVCRKADGVMCPSFQATREEANSTRGRANLLRALISVESRGLASEHVKEALDLCLACKGCKAECPSNVDMAKLKYEFQSHYYENHRRPIRDYLFGYIGTLATLGAPFGRIFNWVTDLGLVRGMAQKVLGVSAKRVFPKFGIRHQQKMRLNDNSPFTAIEECLFLPDTFTHFFEPEIEADALNLLAACGIRVKILPVFGAGRTLISKGFIGPARQHVRHLLDQISIADPAGKLPLVGLEPSEIYTLRDELLDLLPEHSSKIESLMLRAWLIDEYLIRKAAGVEGVRITRAGLTPDPMRNNKILLHGHCYQKAQPPHADGFPIGINASAELLRAAGYEVEILNTGCCGMAGAFGYESEHFDLSMQVGELKLFPAIRSRNKAGKIAVAAIGTSCRSQIEDGTGVSAQHSVQLVSKRLTS